MSSESKSSKAKVFLFGASGLLGSQILHFLTSQTQTANYSNHFEVSVLVRADSLESKDEKKSAAIAKVKASGAHIVIGDAQSASVAEIAQWISGQEIVISALSSHTPGPSIELKLLEAVKLAKVPWLIPGVFGSDITKAVADAIPLIAAKKGLIEAVEASGVNYFIVFNYGFTEYVFNPFLGVDIANATVAIGYSFDSKISTITVPDIAHLTVEALVHRNEPHVKNQRLNFVADTLSFEQITQLLEAHFNKPFKRITYTKEETLAAVAADTSFQNLPARFRTMFGEQKGMWIDKNDSWNVKHAKHIHITTVKEYIAALKL